MYFPFNKKKSAEKAAAKWALKLEDGLTEEEELEFEQWQKEFPESMELLENYEGIMDKFDVLRVRDFESMECPDPCLFTPDFQKGRANKFYWSAGMAVVLVAAGFFSAHFISDKTESKFAGAVTSLNSSIQDYYELPDGSTIELNADTDLDFRYSAQERNFWVKSGEAYFTVAKDRTRPFNVFVLGSRIQALGTQFNVKFQEDSVEVIVTEGVVSVAPRNAIKVVSEYSDESPYVNAISVSQKTIIYPLPEEAVFPVSTISPEELNQELAWKPVTLKFSDTPLVKVVEAFNSYNSSQLIISDEELNELPIDVSFRSNKLEGFVRLIEATHNVVANRQGERIYLYKRN